jgi:hypothetical protein
MTRAKEQAKMIQQIEREARREVEYKKGDPVLYMPEHARAMYLDEDCKKGIVSSVNKKWVFVKYDCADCTMVTGDEPYTAQATDRADLRLIRDKTLAERLKDQQTTILKQTVDMMEEGMFLDGEVVYYRIEKSFSNKPSNTNMRGVINGSGQGDYYQVLMDRDNKNRTVHKSYLSRKNETPEEIEAQKRRNSEALHVRMRQRVIDHPYSKFIKKRESKPMF